MMELLITKSNVSEVLQVAIGYNTDQFNVFIREAQDFDFKPKVCEEFYHDLVQGRAEEPFLKLISGGTYTYNDREYSFRGLADVLSYFTYARFILKCNYVSTTHGFTIKKTSHSEPMELAEKRSMYYKYQKDANVIYEDVVKFIERTQDSFPTWDYCNDNCKPRTTTGFKTRVIQ